MSRVESEIKVGKDRLDPLVWNQPDLYKGYQYSIFFLILSLFQILVFMEEFGFTQMKMSIIIDAVFT